MLGHIPEALVDSLFAQFKIDWVIHVLVALDLRKTFEQMCRLHKNICINVSIKFFLVRLHEF